MSGPAASLREELVRRLEEFGVKDVPEQGRHDGFSSLNYDGKPFAHFHSNNELDLRLTKAIIAREGLVHPPDSRVHPNRSKGSRWIEIRFTQKAQLNDLIRLVKLAIAEL